MSTPLSDHMRDVARLIVAADLALGEFVIDQASRPSAVKRIKDYATRIASLCDEEIKPNTVAKGNL